ncbi:MULTISPECIES: cysteine desulfurase family protein [Acetobacter]|uniref:cysteine desulfurase family protein n=1 Tax=Acetobacter TaxID=434 RepID=UPI000A37C684|nr:MULTISPECIES: aminotransferase class V-fold PLP-dependent enzyme [Acetobacter]MBS0960686.1 aminotransferase class V-fold PLP-dependent enzyme [Acetobacter thailandicus]MBS0986125.1 aminotransferase class V-fold PLP-dependent enzyme [Acetobacter thailandicus]MBS1004026.1 aminotransferase class V-fold PLP-dependent enzyme [Acetobacter thailandicus]
MVSTSAGSPQRQPIIYLDANATEPLRPEARDAFLEAAELTGNPSSVHRAGRMARAMLEQARDDVAQAFEVAPLNCIFTSGGTEANVLAMHGLSAGRRFLVGATEHDAVRKGFPEGADVTWLAVEKDGTVSLAGLEQALNASDTPAFVCLMLANNETGVLHPITDIATLCQRYGAHLHVDGVQAAGRIAFSVTASGVNSFALSGHKTGGPKGAGALLLAGPAPGRVLPLFEGGGQEQGRRGGTQPLPAIAGMAAALRTALQTPRNLSPLRDRIEHAACAVGAVVSGAQAPRLHNTSSLILPGRLAQEQLMRLDLEGICVSAGSACSSGKVAFSHVLQAMGFEAQAGQALRVSLPWNVQEEDVTRFIQVYENMARKAASGLKLSTLI